MVTRSLSDAPASMTQRRPSDAIASGEQLLLCAGDGVVAEGTILAGDRLKCYTAERFKGFMGEVEQRAKATAASGAPQ